MIPDSGEPIHSEVPAGAAFWTPDPGELEERDSIGYFHDVWLLGRVERHEAAAVARDERELVQMADSFACDHEEFERILIAFEYSDTGSIPARFKSAPEADELFGYADSPGSVDLGGLETGVAGLSYALAAVGCIPAASCRWHPGPRSWAPNPVVYLAADRPTVERIQPHVRAAGCGFGLDATRPELLVLGGPSVANIMELARRLIEA
ncbi:hypothetical protein [Streptomyces sp. NPDC005244]|uniref:hypothetical protein n=1 Tax=Streptomyces sp. NPDC005244 TaxID=3364708 RepID=UPI003681050F